MVYRHTIYVESERNKRLAKLAAEASAELLSLHRTPRVHFFREDANGCYERAVRCTGFIDYRTSAEHLDIFVRGGRSPQEIVQTIFHEADHVHSFLGGYKSMTHQERESRAFWFEETMAPAGSNYESVAGELLWKMTKLCVWKGDFKRAQAYHRELKAINPKAAEGLADDVQSPEERRLRIKIEAERCRLESQLEVERFLSDGEKDDATQRPCQGRSIL